MRSRDPPLLPHGALFTGRLRSRQSLHIWQTVALVLIFTNAVREVASEPGLGEGTRLNVMSHLA